MSEELLSGLKEQALGKINDKPEILNEKLDDILNIVSEVTRN